MLIRYHLYSVMVLYDQINLAMNDPSQDAAQAGAVDDKLELNIWLGETKMMFWMIARL